jgi:hypothetical protein
LGIVSGRDRLSLKYLGRNQVCISREQVIDHVAHKASYQARASAADVSGDIGVLPGELWNESV